MKTNKIHAKNKEALEHASGLTLKELAEIASRAEEKLAAWGVSAPGAQVFDKGVALECQEKGWYFLRKMEVTGYILRITRRQETELQYQYVVYGDSTASSRGFVTDWATLRGHKNV